MSSVLGTSPCSQSIVASRVVQSPIDASGMSIVGAESNIDYELSLGTPTCSRSITASRSAHATIAASGRSIVDANSIIDYELRLGTPTCSRSIATSRSFHPTIDASGRSIVGAGHAAVGSVPQHTVSAASISDLSNSLGTPSFSIDYYPWIVSSHD